MLLPLLLTIMATSPNATHADLFIGTYTSPDGSKGIYHATLDLQNGDITVPDLAAEARDPSFLALSPNGHFLYTVHESTAGEFSAYAVDSTQHLRLLNKQSALVPGPCHLSVDRSGRHLFVAGYGTGVLASFGIKSDGSLGDLQYRQQNTGHGPNSGRQEGPHMHAAYPSVDGKYVYACDLGTDEILRLQFNAASGELKPQPSAKLAPGSGPRHLALSPDGRFAFVNGEMTSTVTSFRIDAADGSLHEIQTLSTLPAVHGNNSTAEIHVHPSGRWLYVSNRGHDSIAAYAVSADGHLTLQEIQDATVREPRGFAIDPTGKWLVVGGQNSNNLTALAIDPHTGKLEPTGINVSVGKPVCVVFGKS